MNTTRIISAVSAVLFLAFALVQLNDPDPALWVALYGLVAYYSAFNAFGRNRPVVGWALIVALTSMAFFTVGGFWQWLTQPEKSEIFGEMVYEKPYIEETREFLGTLIALGFVLYQHFAGRK